MNNFEYVENIGHGRAWACPVMSHPRVPFHVARSRPRSNTCSLGHHDSIPHLAPWLVQLFLQGPPTNRHAHRQTHTTTEHWWQWTASYATHSDAAAKAINVIIICQLYALTFVSVPETVGRQERCCRPMSFCSRESSSSTSKRFVTCLIWNCSSIWMQTWGLPGEVYLYAMFSSCINDLLISRKIWLLVCTREPTKSVLLSVWSHLVK